MERFWNKVDKSQECWLWKGWLKKNGYGGFYGGRDRHNVYAHRFSWELIHGQIPSGQCVCHRCDTPACVNPAHLFLGTVKDNLADMRAKGRDNRTIRARGEATRSSKLTEVNVMAILADRRTQAEIAADFSVSVSLVGAIRRREIWRHVLGVV